MNIIINISEILDQSNKLIDNRVQFLNSKRNITMEGEFTKILYVNEFFSMDSLLIEYPLSKKNAPLKFNPIKFNELEKQLIEYYKKYKNINKKTVGLLNHHLIGGNNRQSFDNDLDGTKSRAIKISGIWESYDSVGLTYKIVDVHKVLL